MMSQPSAAPPGHRLIQWATMLAGVSLILVVVNIVLAVLDQNAQAEVNQHQQQIAQAAQLEAVTSVLVRGLQAQADQDPQIQDLLKRAGVTAPPAASAPAPAPAPAPATKP
jgi:hypothetical protein